LLPQLSRLRVWKKGEVMSSAAEAPPKKDRAPFDVGGGPPYDGNMEARLTKLEADVAEIKFDLSVLKATCATKSDIADTKATIIMWVVSAIFLAQLLPALLKSFGI
jgi:hypothetical protein